VKAEPLEFPRGVRYPTVDEIPGGAPSDAAARLVDAQITLVTTGYVRLDREDVAGYSAVVEANVQPANLWHVFQSLVVALLPDVAAPIVGAIDEEPLLGAYTSRDAALAVLAPYADALVHDGFLEFGCMFQLRGVTEEVFVPSAKFIRIWTNTPARAEAALEAAGIPSVHNLRFIDEFPLVREAQPFAGQTSGWFAVLDELRIAFLALPPAESDERSV
jgi:hypothetical protein